MPQQATQPVIKKPSGATAIIDCLVSREWDGLRFEMVNFADSYPMAGDGGIRLVADIYGVGSDDITDWSDGLSSLARPGMIHVHDFRGEHAAADKYQPDVSVVFEVITSSEELEKSVDAYRKVKALPQVIRNALEDLHRRERRQKMVHLRSMSYASA